MRLGHFLLLTILAVIACCSTSAIAEGFVQANSLATDFRRELMDERHRYLKGSVREANIPEMSSSSRLIEKLKELVGNLKTKGGDMRVADIMSSAKEILKELAAVLKKKVRDLHKTLKTKFGPKYKPVHTKVPSSPRAPQVPPNNPLNGEVTSTNAVAPQHSRGPTSPDKPNEASTTTALSLPPENPHLSPRFAQSSLRPNKGPSLGTIDETSPFTLGNPQSSTLRARANERPLSQEPKPDGQ